MLILATHGTAFPGSRCRYRKEQLVCNLKARKGVGSGPVSVSVSVSVPVFVYVCAGTRTQGAVAWVTIVKRLEEAA